MICVNKVRYATLVVTEQHTNNRQGTKTMAKMVFDEFYGELTYAQRAAYRKFNVSPSDHDTLVDTFGKGAHAKITAAVKAASPSGMFSDYALLRMIQNEEISV